MIELDLFSGLEGASAGFKERGHKVITVDNDPRFKPTLVADILALRAEELEAYGPFDFVWASPPCNHFSIMTVSKCWTPEGEPKECAKAALELVRRTLALIVDLRPRAWLLENPVGMLRAQRFMRAYERRTVTYCQYGFKYRKATDLWGGFPPNLRLKRPCKNGAACHVANPRDAHVQNTAKWAGWDRVGQRAIKEALGLARGVPRAAMRAMVPPQLWGEVCMALEAWNGRWAPPINRWLSDTHEEP